MVLINPSTRREVTLISSGIESILHHAIPDETRAVNFHGNQIRKIEGLLSPTLGSNLTSLDLSSNQIRAIENLDALVSLRYLNLAANLIVTVDDGLRKLVSLEFLDLSFNKITCIDGLRCFARSDSRLLTLMLQGNRINRLSSVLPIVSSIRTLKVLAFEDVDEDGNDMIAAASNPICRDSNYVTQMWTHCPGMTSLDGFSASGVAVNAAGTSSNLEQAAELAGLSDLLAFVDNLPDESDETGTIEPWRTFSGADVSTSSSDSQINAVRANFPKIEAALRQFRRNPAASSQQKQQQQRSEVTYADDNDNIEDPAIFEQRSLVVDKSRLENMERQLRELLEGRRATAERPLELTQPGSDDPTSGVPRTASSAGQVLPAGYRTVEEGTQTDNVEVGGEADPARTKNTDNDAYLRNLLGQLDEEREKRWTAEKKTDDLASLVAEINEKRAQERKQIEEALTLVRRLQARLDSGKASQRELEKSVDVLTDANEKLTRDLKSVKQRETALQRLLREVQEKANRQNTDKDERIKKLEEEAKEVGKELRLAAAEAAKFKSETEQLKTLLAEKEKDHREALRGKYSIGSPEIQTLLTKEGDRIAGTFQMRVDTWREKYRELEDEFRLALHLEAERFAKMQSSEEKARKENVELKTALNGLTSRDSRSSGLVKELSDLAKEQKRKMSEMSAKHSNTVDTLKKRCELAETSLSTARERLKAMDELTNAKSQLETKCAALETLVKNVKAEKELWSGELAQQGAALSQDRGRLEAKLEALTAEVASLKKQLERDADSLRIKAKIIDDQTETIKKLKDGLLERDRRLKEANDDHLKKEKETLRRMEEEIQNRAAADERIEYLEKRKDELKAVVAAADEECASLKENNEKLIQKWKERSKLIESLEVKVAEMKRNWDEKEAALTRERDAALSEKDEIRAKSAAIDAAFRSQLDQAQAAHARSSAEIEALKDVEIRDAHAKLSAVEDEMREILREAAENKAQMQKKLKNLTSAFAELQN